MQFEWDEEKARSNLAKHGVSFLTATEVFDDPDALSSPDRVVDGQLRWRTVGRIGFVTVLFVAHVYVNAQGDEIVRIISARKAKRHEREAYERGDESAIR